MDNIPHIRNTVSANELTASGTAVPDQATKRTTALGNMRIVKAIYDESRIQMGNVQGVAYDLQDKLASA